MLTEYVGTTMDITERTQADSQLRQLSGRLLQLQDDERRRIARELHDSTGQTLTGLSLRLAVVEGEIASLSRGARQALAESASLLDQASRELRSLSYLLHPPFLDDSGLRSAVPWYVHGFSHRSGIQVQVDLPAAMGRLQGDLETTLFRIIQECLTNILKHSGSQTASVRIVFTENEVTLEISDQGKGMPAEIVQNRSNAVSNVGIGIMGMRERVRQLHGRLEITSGAWGTKVRATLPLNGKLG
jgi:signal transduction histidine kinase